MRREEYAELSIEDVLRNLAHADLLEEADELKKSLHAFMRRFWHVVEPTRPFADNWHIHAICEHLEAVSRGEIKNLLINVPPGTSKSTIVSVMFPAWEWLSNPSLRYFGASYSEPLALRDAGLCRDIVLSDEYRVLHPKFGLRKGQDNARKYVNEHKGWRLATSVGGRGTGEHPHRKIVDDPHNVKESESDVERQAALDWYDGTLSSRGVALKAATIVIMQRLHEKDLSGHIMSGEEYAVGNWDHLVIPMEYERGRTYPTTRLKYKDKRTQEGALLWPDVFSAHEVARLKSALRTPYRIAGQLQQRPSPDGGGILKMKQHIQLWPKDRKWPVFLHVLQSYDTAFTEQTKNDPTAHTAWGVFKIGELKCVMLLEAWREWLSYPDAKQRLMDHYHAKYGGDKEDPLNPARVVDTMLIEEKGSGIAIIQELRRANMVVSAYNPGHASKVERAHLASAILEANIVYVPESRKEPGQPIKWARDFIHECEVFPNGEHDDYVDTFTQMTRYLERLDLLELPVVEPTEPEDHDYHAERKRRRNPYAR